MNTHGFVQSGSASYYRQYFSVYSGILPAGLTFLISCSVKHRKIRDSFCVVSIVFLMGPIVVELMNGAEGGTRGTSNVIQNIPYFGHFYNALTWIYAVGVLLAFVLFIPIICIGTYSIYRQNNMWLKHTSLTITALMCCYCVRNWGGFVLD